MRKILLIISIISFIQLSNAQSTSDLGKISLSVIMPENVDGLGVSQLSKLESKIIQIVTNTGLAATGYNNSFVIYPKFAIYESNIIEGGMQNITVVKCELSLFVKQVDNNIVFSSVSKMLSGSGNNKSNALTNAISKINTSDNDLKVFVEAAKIKIVKYYESKCSDIILKSESLSKKQAFEESLALLMTVPEEVSCYNKVQEKTIAVYKAYQDQKCKTILNEANVNITGNNFSAALDKLALIDPSSSCFNEAKLVMKKLDNKISAEQKRQLDLQMKMYNDQIALEKQRINAVKEIAVAYYKNQPSVHYNYIIR